MRFTPTAGLVACLALSFPAAAQVQMVIPFPAGGSTDIIGRALQPALSEALGTQVVIHNVGGASGIIGASEVARARPDGQTLLFSPVGPVAIQPHMRSNPPYRLDSFTAVCQVTDNPVVMMTPRTSGLRTLDDLLRRGRAEGGNFPYGSAGIGTIPHISMVGLVKSTGVGLTHVPYRGAGPVMQAFAQGSVAIYSDQANLVRQYELHPIVAFTEQRLPDFPDTPTLRELGHDLVFSIWSGIYLPAAAPAAMVQRLDAACRRAVETPQLRELFTRLAQQVVYRNSADFARFTATEYAKYARIVEAAGVRID